MRRAPVQSFGGLPGAAQPYGYLALDGANGLITVVTLPRRLSRYRCRSRATIAPSFSTTRGSYRR
ncbi:MAG: hypothetical protein NZ699_18360 [Roseiflexus sp.]|nr:hypothetical protein [Roseiflexus sp.]MDW8147980.1 hypothetical protein [Roseiflexaceae bacterium]